MAPEPPSHRNLIADVDIGLGPQFFTGCILIYSLVYILDFDLELGYILGLYIEITLWETFFLAEDYFFMCFGRLLDDALSRIALLAYVGRSLPCVVPVPGP